VAPAGDLPRQQRLDLVAALLIEHDSKLDWGKACAILSSSARKPDGSAEPDAFGAGILDAASAPGERP
jgi:hypothetical protein